MNYKKFSLMLITLGFMFITSGGVSSFIIGLQEDRKDSLMRMNEVNDEFEIFSTNTTVFEEKRDELYNSVLTNIYYDNMQEEDNHIKNVLSNYENLVDELTKNTNHLNSLCEDMYYSDSIANNRCNNYKSIYEQVVNYFVSDIKSYNEIVDKYNKYQEENSSEFRIDKYNTKKNYIDYNKDKKYDGKE